MNQRATFYLIHDLDKQAIFFFAREGTKELFDRIGPEATDRLQHDVMAILEDANRMRAVKGPPFRAYEQSSKQPTALGELTTQITLAIQVQVPASERYHFDVIPCERLGLRRCYVDWGDGEFEKSLKEPR